MPLTLWIDADATPRDVKELIYRTAERLQVKTVFVANGSLTVPRAQFISTVLVRQGADVADSYIVEQSAPGDLAVTADIPLAARLVPKGVVAIDPRGDEYTEENIQERLSLRNFMQEMRDSGVATGGPKAYGPREKQQFANALDRLLTKLLKSR